MGGYENTEAALAQQLMASRTDYELDEVIRSILANPVAPDSRPVPDAVLRALGGLFKSVFRRVRSPRAVGAGSNGSSSLPEEELGILEYGLDAASPEAFEQGRYRNAIRFARYARGAVSRRWHKFGNPSSAARYGGTAARRAMQRNWARQRYLARRGQQRTQWQQQRSYAGRRAPGQRYYGSSYPLRRYYRSSDPGRSSYGGTYPAQSSYGSSYPGWRYYGSSYPQRRQYPRSYPWWPHWNAAPWAYPAPPSDYGPPPDAASQEPAVTDAVSGPPVGGGGPNGGAPPSALPDDAAMADQPDASASGAQDTQGSQAGPDGSEIWYELGDEWRGRRRRRRSRRRRRYIPVEDSDDDDNSEFPGDSPSSQLSWSGPHQASGRWVRRGRRIVLVNI